MGRGAFLERRAPRNNRHMAYVPSTPGSEQPASYTSFVVYGQCRNYRTEVEEDEGTVIYRTLLFHNSVFLGRCEKNVSDLPLNFLRRSIILVGALLFYNSVFPHFSHISHFRSIINVSRAPFYN